MDGAEETLGMCESFPELICSLCKGFYHLGWVTGTGGGISIRDKTNHDMVYIAPSGVQKERLIPDSIFVLSLSTNTYLRAPPSYKPSACTPLFKESYTLRDAGACIHTHSQSAVLVTLLYEDTFQIKNQEMIKGIPRGQTGKNFGYHDTLVVPIIENTPHEEDLRDSLRQAILDYPETAAVLVRRHGIYVWGATWEKAKAACECYHYLFSLAVEIKKLGLNSMADLCNKRTEQ